VRGNRLLAPGLQVDGAELGIAQSRQGDVGVRGVDDDLGSAVGIPDEHDRNTCRLDRGGDREQVVALGVGGGAGVVDDVQDAVHHADVIPREEGAPRVGLERKRDHRSHTVPPRGMWGRVRTP